MQRHAFRSVCGRTRPELEQASDALRTCIRQFSTTQLQAADDNGTPNPSVRGRSRAATSEINSLARARSPARAGHEGSGPAGAPKILDVKSLPRLSFRGRGGARGDGVFRGRGRGDARRGSGFTPRGGAGFNARGGSNWTPNRGGGISRDRGGFGARGGRGGRGGRGRGGARGGRKEGDDKERRARGDDLARLDADEQAFEDSIRFGTATKYSPSLTINSLSDFAPSTPTSAAGKAAAVLQNLSILGTADHVGAPQAFQARHYAAEIEESGLRFFADTQAKAAAELYLQKNRSTETTEGETQAATPTITDAEEAVRKVILEKAVNGQHETPKFATDPAGVARSWHLRAETYKTNDVDAFANKLTSLLAKKGGRAAAKPKVQA